MPAIMCLINSLFEIHCNITVSSLVVLLKVDEKIFSPYYDEFFL